MPKWDIAVTVHATAAFDEETETREEAEAYAIEWAYDAMSVANMDTVDVEITVTEAVDAPTGSV